MSNSSRPAGASAPCRLRPLAARLFLSSSRWISGSPVTVVQARDFRRVERHVIGTARGRMHAAPLMRAMNLVEGQRRSRGVVDRTRASRIARPAESAREAIEHSRSRNRTSAALLDRLMISMSGTSSPDPCTSRFDASGTPALSAARSNVTGRNLRDAVLLTDEICLRTFARAGAPNRIKRMVMSLGTCGILLRSDGPRSV